MAGDPVLSRAFIRELVELANELGYTVERSDDGPPALGGGVCIHRLKCIRISTRLFDLDAWAVLTHEVAHALLHSGADWWDEAETPAREAQAKAVQFLVLKHYGYSDLMIDGPPSSATDPDDQVRGAVERIVTKLPAGPFFGQPEVPDDFILE